MRLRDYITYTHWLQGSIDLQLGRYKDARDQAQMGLALAREHGARNCVCKDLLLLGCLELAQGTPAMAYQFLTEGADTFRRIGGHWDDRCRTQVSLAQATHALGDAARAGQHLCLALEIAVESGAVPLLLWALPAMALLLAGKGKSKRAVELYALAPPYPLVAKSPWFEDVAGNMLGEVAATLPAERVAVLQEHGPARDLHANLPALPKEQSTLPPGRRLMQGLGRTLLRHNDCEIAPYTICACPHCRVELHCTKPTRNQQRPILTIRVGLHAC